MGRLVGKIHLIFFNSCLKLIKILGYDQGHRPVKLMLQITDQGLKNFELISSITFSTIKVNASDSGALSRRLAKPDNLEAELAEKQVELFFTISGEVELE